MKMLMNTLQGRTIIFLGAQRTLHKISMAIVVSLMVVLHSSVGVSFEMIENEMEEGVIYTAPPGTSKDYFVPFDLDTEADNFALGVRVRGADGGRRYHDGVINKHYRNGGGGATIIANLRIAPDAIVPGSTLRAIVGVKGQSRNSAGTAPSAGGGGSALLMQAPGQKDWQVLVAAGGGGGAYADCCAVRKTGGSASAGNCGNPDAGCIPDSRSRKGGYGGSANNVCDSDSKARHGAEGMPRGGDGGSGSTISGRGVDGGWGFGGGGGGYSTFDGGGGGYCGGKGGKRFINGQGGGSFLDEAFLTYSPFRIHGASTASPKDGIVTLELTRVPTPIAPVSPCFRPDDETPLLVSGQEHSTPDGFRLTLEGTAGKYNVALAMYDPYGQVLWSIPVTDGYVEKGDDEVAIFSDTGNILLYNNLEDVKWESNTAGVSEPLLCIGDGGMSIFEDSETHPRMVWSTFFFPNFPD